MSERAAFISAILTTPNDDTPRLVFADWLEENGAPERAEFVRVQIEAAKLPGNKRDKSTPAKRAAVLLKKHEKKWREAVGVPRSGSYSRGFLTDLRFSNRDFPTRVAALLNHEPATDFRLDLHNSMDDTGVDATPEWVDALAKNPHLRAVTRIDSQTGGFGEHFPRLFKSPHFLHLHHISVFEDVIGAAGVKAIASSPSPFVLTDLDLNSGLNWEDMDETPDVIAAIKCLATAPRFSTLAHLGLPFNSLGDKSIKELLKSKTLPRGMRLGLAENNYDTDKYDEKLTERFTLEEF